MTMHFRSTQPAPGPLAITPGFVGKRRGAGSGPYQESTQELWHGSQVLPLALAGLPGELLLEFERQRGTWGRVQPLQART